MVAQHHGVAVVESSGRQSGLGYSRTAELSQTTQVCPWVSHPGAHRMMSYAASSGAVDHTTSTDSSIT